MTKPNGIDKKGRHFKEHKYPTTCMVPNENNFMKMITEDGCISNNVLYYALIRTVFKKAFFWMMHLSTDHFVYPTHTLSLIERSAHSYIRRDTDGTTSTHIYGKDVINGTVSQKLLPASLRIHTHILSKYDYKCANYRNLTTPIEVVAEYYLSMKYAYFQPLLPMLDAYELFTEKDAALQRYIEDMTKKFGSECLEDGPIDKSTCMERIDRHFRSLLLYVFRGFFKGVPYDINVDTKERDELADKVYDYLSKIFVIKQAPLEKLNPKNPLYATTAVCLVADKAPRDTALSDVLEEIIDEKVLKDTGPVVERLKSITISNCYMGNIKHIVVGAVSALLIASCHHTAFRNEYMYAMSLKAQAQQGTETQEDTPPLDDSVKSW